MNSVTKTYHNPESDGLSLHQALADELAESPVKKRMVQCYQSFHLGCCSFSQYLPFRMCFFGDRSCSIQK